MSREYFPKDAKGSTTIELAFALPVLVMLMVGILQYGIVLHASSGLRHALGEGIRHAKVYPDATESEVLTKARDGLAGIDPSGIAELTFERGTLNGAEFGRIAIRYEITPFIPFVPLPTIKLTETKTAYLPS